MAEAEFPVLLASQALTWLPAPVLARITPVLMRRIGRVQPRLLANLTQPGGLVFISTLNRTLRSLAVAKIGAEYIARLLPAGTHDWRRFVAPEALAGYGREAGLRLIDITGMEMSPLTGNWRASRDVGVNYLAAFQK